MGTEDVNLKWFRILAYFKADKMGVVYH